MIRNSNQILFCINNFYSVPIVTSLDIKKIKTTIDNLYLEKQKIEKGDKAKKNKGKGKAKLKMEDENVSIPFTFKFIRLIVYCIFFF